MRKSFKNVNKVWIQKIKDNIYKIVVEKVVDEVEKVVDKILGKVVEKVVNYASTDIAHIQAQRFISPSSNLLTEVQEVIG